MSVKGIHRLAVGSLIAMGLVSMILGIATLDGFESSASGDLVMSSTIWSDMILATMLVGAVALLSLALAHVTSRRPKPARVTGASVAADA
jgi:hypothetical protein